MSSVAIVGAGDIGAAAARALSLRARVDVVRLIDEHESVARGKALDLVTLWLGESSANPGGKVR